MDKISKLDSNVIRGLLVAIAGVIGSVLHAFGVDDALFSQRAEPIIDAICTLITAGGTAWAMYARLFLPTPPVTETAVRKTEERLRQGGFVRVNLLVGLVIAALAGGCTANMVKPTDVLSVACTPSDEYQIERCAEAIGDVYEVYLSRLRELVADPQTPHDVRRQLQAIDRELTPPVRLLIQASAAYVRLRDASAPQPEVAAAEQVLRDRLAIVEPQVRSLPNL